MNSPDLAFADVRAHLTAYWASKGVVDFIRGAVWDGHAADRAKCMLMAAMKSMDLSLEALQKIKARVGNDVWWIWCAESHPLMVLDNSDLFLGDMARGIREAAHVAGLPAAFSETMIRDMTHRLRTSNT